MSCIIYRKSSNTNSFGQRQYHALDLGMYRRFAVTATDNFSIGQQVAYLGEHTIHSVSATYTSPQWVKVCTDVAHTVHSALDNIAAYLLTRFDYVLPPPPPKQHPRKKDRPNPHHARLLRALEPHRGGYSTDYGQTQSAVEFDVSFHTGKDWDDYVQEYRATLDATRLLELDTLMPPDDPWWADKASVWENNHYRWGGITTDMWECFADAEYYNVHPVTGMQHVVDWQLAGRGGKHLLVTQFNGVNVTCNLAYTLCIADRSNLDREGITNQWCRDFAEMLEWWNTLDVRTLVTKEYEYQEYYCVRCAIDDELCRREAEAARLVATDAWFAV